MSTTDRGMLVGAVLALTAVAFGFWSMILVAVFVVVGFGVGRVLDGKLDLRSVADALRGRRSS